MFSKNPTVLIVGSLWLSISVCINAASGVQQTRTQRIAELRGDLGVDLRVEDYDSWIPVLAHAVAPGDRTWNATHARWRPLCDLIARDLHEDLASRVAIARQSSNLAWERRLDSSLSEADLEELLAFFRTDVGRNYVELQRVLSSLIDRGATDVSLKMDSPEGLGDTLSAPVTGEQIASRRRLIALTFNAMMLSKISSQDPIATNPMMTIILRMYGEQMDALSRRFGDELGRFEEFNRSTVMRKVVDAGVQVSSEPGYGTDARELQSFVTDKEPQIRGAEWHAVYSAAQ